MPLTTASASSAIPGTTVPAATVACSSPTSNPIRAVGTWAATVVRSAFSSQPGGFSMSARRRAERLQAPARERADHGSERRAGLGELVDRRGGGRRKLAPRDHAARLELLEPGGEHVRRAAWQPLVEIAVAQRAVLELAHEQQRPALADEVERVSHGAVLVVGLHVIEESAVVAACFEVSTSNYEDDTCKKQVNGARVVTINRSESSKGWNHESIKQAQVDRTAAALHGAVHGRPRHRDRQCRASLDPDRPRVLAGEPAVGHLGLLPRLRRLPAARRPPRRPARAPARLHGRARHLHDRLAPLRPLVE